MDILMFVLQGAVMLPLAVRMFARSQPQGSLGRELALSAYHPGFVLHVLGFALIWTGFGVRFWTVGIERTLNWPGVLASVLLALATALMFASFSVLTSWRLLPGIEDGHQFCASGVYRVVRHPIYLAFDLTGIGVAVAVPSPLVIAGALALIVAGQLRARSEEKALIEAFGTRYLEYRSRVAARIPGVF